MPDPGSSPGQALSRHPAFPVIPALGNDRTDIDCCQGNNSHDPLNDTNEGPFWKAYGVVADDRFAVRFHKDGEGMQSLRFLCQSIEDENRLFLLEEWDTEENLMTHLNSNHFRVLQGAMNLLKEPYERMFYTVFHLTGIEKI